jgi:hypothetical protein
MDDMTTAQLCYSLRFKILVVVDFFATLTIRLIQKIIANMYNDKSSLKYIQH